jgi:hypothetical protein
MKKNAIVQFVCFTTNLELEQFVDVWEPYAKKVVSDGDITLEQASTPKVKSKYRYVSKHTGESSDFRFVFMKGRTQEHFPEHTAKVINAGGYTVVQMQCEHSNIKNDVKVMVFLDQAETNLGFYQKQTYRHLNIYSAYYESCLYGHILEFFLQEADVPVLVDHMKTRHRAEMAVYTECSVVHS